MAAVNFETLTRLFDRMRLWTNLGKTVGVICSPLSFCLEPVIGRLQAPDEEGRLNILVPTETAGPVPVLWIGPGGRFASGAPSKPEQYRTIRTVGEPQPPPKGETQTYQVSFPSSTVPR